MTTDKSFTALQEEIFSAFTPTANPVRTGQRRISEGHEWSQRGTINGADAILYYLVPDGEDAFDAAHVSDWEIAGVRYMDKLVDDTVAETLALFE